MFSWESFNQQIAAPEMVQLHSEYIEEAGVKVFVQREDSLHPRLAGNKWRKLKYNLQYALQHPKSTLVSFGGAYSNHIAALAEAGSIFGFKTLGIIRGEEDLTNPTLNKAKALGMEVRYISRSAYRDKHELAEDMATRHPDWMIIPEGGTNLRALTGAAEIITSVSENDSYTHWVVACGTGGTAAGMITALKDQQRLMGISVLKGQWMRSEINGLLARCSEPANNHNWEINSEYHFGGYAKYDTRLIDFINDFMLKFKIRLDPIYTGKAFYGAFDLIRKGYFPTGSRIVLIHTGGLQGIAAFEKQHGKLFY